MLHDENGNLKTNRQKTVIRASVVIAMALLLALTPFVGFGTAKADGGLTLSTTYPGVTIAPGQDVTFDLTVKNDSGGPQNVALSVPTLPEGWTAYFEGDSKPVSRVFVDNTAGSNTASVSLVVNVPDDAKEQTQSIVATAKGDNGAVSNLKMDVTISKQEFAQGSLTAQYQELEGSSTSNFSFSMTLKNNSSDQQSYSLTSGASDGWQVKFTSSDGQQIASLNVDSSRSESITVGITPPTDVKAGDYSIPVSAISSNETLKMDFKVTITGTYGMTLTTPSGLLSTDAIAGQSSSVTMTIQNTGTADLKDISLTTKSTPTDWTVTFDKDKIDSLAAGQSTQVTANIKAANDAVTGDYVVSLTAKTNEATSQADFRVTVKTSTIWGVVGLVIIAAVIVALVLVFRKFGRR